MEVKLTPLGEFKDTDPGDLSQGARELIHWYEFGEGATKYIHWGTDGDFARCEAIAEKHMTPEQAAGFCSNRHLGATGVRPGQEKSAEAKADIPDTTAKEPEPDDEDPKVTGVMVALYPSPDAASQIAVRGGEKPDDLHITLAYMGNVSDSGTNGLDLAASASQIIAACQIAAATHEPLTGSVGGIGKFPDSGSGVPIIALVDVPGLTALRESVFEALTDAQLPVKTDHGFTPHMTLGYNLDLALIPMTAEVPVTFDQLVVSVGEQRQMVPLGVDAGADPSLAPPAGVEMPPVADDAAAVALKAMAYDPAIEKGSEAGHRPPVTTERKDYPFLTGTIQERMDSIRCALEDYFLGSLDDEERDKHYVSMDGTWDDRVVCTVNNWREVGDDKCRTYELSYTVNDDGSIILGDPEEVRLAVRVIEAPDSDPDDAEEAIPPGDLMYLPEMVSDVVRAVKVCSTGERKAGRVLSANNATRLKQVVETLITVLEAAGIEINPDASATTPTVIDMETTAPSAHDGKSVTIDSADLAGVLAGLTAD
jgi:2'-5' RNA ligase